MSGIAVDPQAVISALRQRYAEALDQLHYENATLTAALVSAQAEITALRDVSGAGDAPAA